MTETPLNGFSVAILATDGFEQSELLDPREALEQAGADTELVSLKEGNIRGWHKQNWGEEVVVDCSLERADSKDYDALLLPGGVMNPDTLRMQPRAVQFVKDFLSAGKPVAAICHGPWTIVESGLAEGHRMTSWPSLKTDIENAGAEWIDQEVVVDDNLITSRKPDDIPAFNRELINTFGRFQRRRDDARRQAVQMDVHDR